MSKPIVCLKLITGEELIATIASSGNSMIGTTPEEIFKPGEKTWEAAGTYIIENILSIAVQPTGTGNMALALIPWLIGDHEAPAYLNFDKHVMAVYVARPEIEKAYLQQTSGIQIASASSVPVKGKDLGSKIKLGK